MIFCRRKTCILALFIILSRNTKLLSRILKLIHFSPVLYVKRVNVYGFFNTDFVAPDAEFTNNKPVVLLSFALNHLHFPYNSFSISQKEFVNRSSKRKSSFYYWLNFKSWLYKFEIDSNMLGVNESSVLLLLLYSFCSSIFVTYLEPIKYGCKILD